MTLRHPLQRTLHLAVLLLGSALSLRPVAIQAEAHHFAHGLVIYKNALSDQPVHYHGTLFLSADTSGPIWLQYQVGQPKPFYVAREMFVSEIKFGTLFEADFTTQKHVDYCKGIQEQLAAAAKASPLLASAANAASKAIQAEIDEFGKGHVRLSGTWTDRSQYDAILAAKEKARKAEEESLMKAAAEMKVREEASSRARAAMAAEDKLRLANLNRAYASLPAQNLLASLDSNIKTSGTLLNNNRALPVKPPARATLDTYIPLPFLREDQRIDTRLQILGADAETAPAILITTTKDATHILLAQAALYLESPGPGQPFLPRSQAELAALRQALDKYDPSICQAFPDVIAANTILHSLTDTVPNVISTPFVRRDLSGYTIHYDVFNPDPNPDRHLRLLLITLYPES